MQSGAAERVFAREFNTGCAGRSQEEVRTPLGVCCTRIFVVGALTEVQGKAGGPVQGRISDPTGAFLVRIPLREESLAESFTALPVPSFVAITGTCQCGLRAGDAQPFIIPEIVMPADREARDAWIGRTAGRTLDRVERFQEILDGGSAMADEREAIRLCSIDPKRLRDMAEMVLAALDVLKPGQQASAPAAVSGDPREKVLVFLASPRDPPLFRLEEILAFGMGNGFSEKEIRLALEALLEEGECYMPRNGLIKLA